MNRFSKINGKPELLDALIEHLQLLKDNRYNLSHIEKDILLQDLRDAYLLLLSFQPVEDSRREEKQDPLMEAKEEPARMEELEVKEVYEERVEECSAEEAEKEQIQEDPAMEPDTLEEEKIRCVETPGGELEEDVSAMTGADTVEIHSPDAFQEPAPSNRSFSREPLLFSEDEFVPQALFEAPEEEAPEPEVPREEVIAAPSWPEEYAAAQELEQTLSHLEEESDRDELVEAMQNQGAVEQPAAKRSLNDLLLEQREDNSLNARFQNAKVSDLAKSITINDKFLFIRELFSNKGEEFSKALQMLNRCGNIEEAFEHLETLQKQYLWDSASPAYLAFCDLVRRKF